MEITFLIPAYNEAETIAEVLDRIAKLDLGSQLRGYRTQSSN